MRRSSRSGRLDDRHADVAAHLGDAPVHPETRGEHGREHRARGDEACAEQARARADERHGGERYQHDRRGAIAHQMEAPQDLADERGGASARSSTANAAGAATLPIAIRPPSQTLSATSDTNRSADIGPL